MRNGVNLSRPVPEEFHLAERLVELIPSAEMVKFGKNGSDATAGAVRLARAATGRDVILTSDADPFLGVHDWFIGSTVMNSGVPAAVQRLTKNFVNGNLESLESQLNSNQGKVAAIVIEPASSSKTSSEYLRGVRELADSHGALLVFDETISGFRFDLSGAQHHFGVTPDLSTFGKGIANGYPLSALVGKSNYMELGGIRHTGKRVFLMSSTYGSERVGLAAGLQTIKLLEKRKVIPHLWETGEKIKRAVIESARSNELNEFVTVAGFGCSPRISFHDEQGEADRNLQTLFMEKMLKQGFLLSSNLFSPALAHSSRIIRQTELAIWESMSLVGSAIKNNQVEELLDGLPIRPVFRAHN
jgi:glutamate-1-semialdehyde 2,1-aminomutase